MPYELTESERRAAGVARTDVMLAFDELAPDVRQRIDDLLVVGNLHEVGMKANPGRASASRDILRTLLTEIDILWPPDEAEIAARIADYVDHRETEAVIATAKTLAASNQRWPKHRTDPRYVRLTEHAAKFTMGWLASSHRPPPRIEFFLPDGKANGYFNKSRDPLAIRIALGLSDAELVRTGIHETCHYVHMHGATDATAEETARYEEERLFALYTERFGRGFGDSWESEL